MSEYAISATMKAGTGFDAPWLVVYANSPSELDTRLKGIIEGDTMELLVHGSVALRTAFQIASDPDLNRQVAEGTRSQVTRAEMPQRRTESSNVVQGGWGNAPQQPTDAQVQGGGHPPCPLCGGLVTSKRRNRKDGSGSFTVISCVNQRAKGDGHVSRFAD